MSFLERLRQGRVFRVGTAYALVAWLLVQAADVFFPALHFPDWTLTLAAGLALAGLPVALVLAWVYDASHPAPGSASGDATSAGIPGQALNYVLMGVVILAVAFLFVDRFWLSGTAPASGDAAGEGGRASDRSPMRASVILLPEEAPIAMGVAAVGIDSVPIALLADGATLVYAARTGDGSRLYRHDLGGFGMATPVPGTEGAIHPFPAPSGLGVGFLTDDRVQRIDLGDGTLTSIAAATAPVRGFWLADDSTYVADEQTIILRRYATPRATGERLISGLRGSISDVLADGRVALSSRKRVSMNGSFADLLWNDLVTGEARELGLEGFDPQLLPDGRLLFAREDKVYVVAFDAELGQVLGDPVAVLDDVATEPMFTQVHLTVGADGTLAYIPGGNLSRGEIVAVAADGEARALPGEPLIYGAFDLAHDDATIAAHVMDVQDHVVLHDLAAGTRRKLAGSDGFGWPKFSRQGDLAITGVTPMVMDTEVWVAPASGGPARSVLDTDEFDGVIADWSPAGDRLAVSAFQTESMGQVEVDGQGRLSWFEPAGEAYEWGAVYSPDGRWLAYSSDITGRFEVWIVSIEDPSIRRQVSTGGGIEAVWCPCGRIFFRRGDQFLASAVSTDGEPSIGPERIEFTVPGFLDTPGRSYDVSSDGTRLYTVRRVAPLRTDRVHLISHWLENLPGT